jgi:acyl-CoA synthetase (AMP-forming)/AMP-acid ligase II
LFLRVQHHADTDSTALLRFVRRDGSVVETSLGSFVDGAFGLAAGLQAQGFNAGDVIAVRGSGNSLHYCQAVLGVTLAGMMCLPLVSLLGDADVEAVLDLSNARALLSERVGRRSDVTAHLARLAASRPELSILLLGEGVPVAGTTKLDALPRARTVQPLADDDPAFVLFTSGTTSMPKGVVHSHRTILAEVLDFASQLDLTESGRFLQPFPVGHVGGLVGMFMAAALGREVVMLHEWNAAVAFEMVNRFGVTACGSTPHFATTLFDERDRHGFGLETLRTMESGGGPVGSGLVLRADKFGVRLSRCYGSTEHPTVTTHRACDPLDVRSATDGKPTNGSEVRIVDAGLEDIPPGRDGEVLVRGPEQFLGYVSGDQSSIVADGWFRTGDLGHLDQDGRLTITGRLKEIIIRGGENISMNEVESILVLHNDIREAAVVGVPDARLGERVHAFVVLASGASPVTVEQLREHFVSRGIAKFKTPELVTTVESLPRNQLGKVQRHLLRSDEDPNA